MTRTPQKLLADIAAACEAIAAFTAGRGRVEYSNDLMLRSAVERQFMILGEAVRRLELLAPDLAVRIEGYRRIIDFRNVIAHGYDAVDDDIVWQAVIDKVPAVLVAVQRMLAEVVEQP